MTNMDIKDLNKSQLILLAVLLSFITSIATGITTVTLMQQAPEAVTVPVNRVIRQTIEKIEQVEGKTVTQTVVVKEEDLVVDAIAKGSGAVFTLTKDGQAGFEPAEVSAGHGFAVSTDGIIAADALLAPGEGTYYAKNASGKFRAHFVATGPAGFSLLRIGAPLNATDQAVFSVPVSGDVEKMKAGQKIIILGQNITTDIIEESGKVDITVSVGSAGGLVLNLDGEALGIALTREGTSFASMKEINDALAKLTPATAQ